MGGYTGGIVLAATGLLVRWDAIIESQRLQRLSENSSQPSRLTNCLSILFSKCRGRKDMVLLPSNDEEVVYKQVSYATP